MRTTGQPNQQSSLETRLLHSNHLTPSKFRGLTLRFVVSIFVSICLLLLLVGCMSPSVSSPPKSADQAAQKVAVQEFFNEVVAANIYGLPSEAELERLAPFMSERLVSLFQQAQAQQAADRARHKGTEPPLVQGSPFVSLFEGATTVISITPGQQPTQWAVKLAYGQGADTVQWVDIADVTLESGRWVVSDVTFAGQWDFARHGHLSDVLKAVRAPAR